MSHEIEQLADGTAAVFSAREPMWHRLGTVTEGALTAEEALKVAQLDWTVYKSEEPVRVPVVTEQGVTMVEVPGKYATYRDHPKLGLDGLGVVGEQYTVIQNSEAFEFLNALADESGAVFETAGSLNNGQRVFVSMKMPDSIELAGGQDVIDLYLAATTSHNGTKAFTAMVTPVRPVCANTVRLALHEAVSTWNLKHTSNVKGRVQQAREALGMTFRYAEAFEKEVQALAAASFSEAQFQKFVTALVKEPKDATLRQQNRVEQTRQEMMALWHAPTQENVTGTKWAAWNAVVEWADWLSPVRTPKGADKAVLRAKRVFDGSNDRVKQKAYSLLTSAKA